MIIKQVAFSLFNRIAKKTKNQADDLFLDAVNVPVVLLIFVSGFIFIDRITPLGDGGTLIPETLSGPEVLQCRNGKCSEFSTLFASLARSLGIPTRIVLGDPRRTPRDARGMSGHSLGRPYTRRQSSA